MNDKLKEVIKEYKAKTKKECYKVTSTNEETNILDDKIGGYPYIPVGEEYPTDSNGNPMLLLIQVDLGKLELNNYPKGILEVFITTNMSEIYENFELPRESYKIKFYKEGLEYKNDIPHITPTEDCFYSHPIKLNFSKEKEYKPYNMSDDTMVNLLLDLLEEKFDTQLKYPMQMEEKLNINYYDLQDELNDEVSYNSNIGGYPIFINEPDIDYYDGIECLMYISSTTIDGLEIGADLGSFYVLIPQNDLKNGNFDNATLKINFE